MSNLTRGAQAMASLLRGQPSRTVPFWEVWFAMVDMQRKHWGDWEKVESHIAMAAALGNAAVPVGFVNTNVGFAHMRDAAKGAGKYLGGLLRSRQQLDERPLPDWAADIERFRANQAKVRAAGLLGVLYLPWCFHTVATGMGLEHLCMALYDDFAFVRDCCAWVEERNRAAIRQVVAAVRPDLVLFDGDCAYKTGLMVSPAMFRELTFEQTRQTVALVRELDIPYTLHTDGKLDEVAPMLIELGFAAVHGCEKQANDLGQLVARFGGDITLVGNMDVGFLAAATPAEVRRETEAMLRLGSSRARFIAACNTSPKDYIPEANYRAFCETIAGFAGE